MASKWVKLCTKYLTCRDYQLTLGENVDVHEYNPKLCMQGGLHFCEDRNAPSWAHELEYDWVCDVTIPPDAEVTHGDDKSKASKLTLSNHRPLRECPEIYLAAVRQNGWALQYVPVELKTSEICLAAVLQNGRVLKYVPDELKTFEICLNAIRCVHGDGRALEYVPDELKTVDMCLAAVQDNRMALKYVPVGLKTVDVCLTAMTTTHSIICHDDYTFNHMPDDVNTLQMCLNYVHQCKVLFSNHVGLIAAINRAIFQLKRIEVYTH